MKEVKNVKDVIHLVRKAPDNIRYKRKEDDAEYLMGEEAREAILDMLRGYYDATHPSFCVYDTKAKAGFLRWLEEDWDDEEIEEQHTVGYGMTVDEGGRARASVVIRDRDLQVIGGVQMSPAETMKLCRWAWGTAVSQARADIYDPLATEGVTYVREQVGEMLKDLQEEMPEIVGGLLDKAARDAICDMAARDAAERIEVRLMRETRKIEKRWAERVVQLASIATKDTDAQREKQLNDPMVQSYITRAVDLCADSQSQ